MREEEEVVEEVKNMLKGNEALRYLYATLEAHSLGSTIGKTIELTEEEKKIISVGMIPSNIAVPVAGYFFEGEEYLKAEFIKGLSEGFMSQVNMIC